MTKKKSVIGIKKRAKKIGMINGIPQYKKSDLLFADKVKSISMKKTKPKKKKSSRKLVKKGKEIKKKKTTYSFFCEKLRNYKKRHTGTKVKANELWQKVMKMHSGDDRPTQRTVSKYMNEILKKKK